MKTIVMKNADGKAKNRNKEVRPKIMSAFLICSFITSCLHKPREIVRHHQNITPAGHFTGRPDRSNPVHSNHSPKCKTENKTEIGTNPLWSVKLAGLTSSTKLLRISNSSGLIPPASNIMKCEIICKMPVIIMRPFENRANFIKEGALGSLADGNLHGEP